jgi:CO/xanthine dehydrogenase FAD-binding subunit
LRTTKFEYHRARTVEEALSLFSEKAPAGYMAGGTDLLPKCRCLAGSACQPPGAVVDIKPIPELNGIEPIDDGALSIGAAAPVAEVGTHPLVRKHYPVLSDCCLSLGSYPLRNRATVGGNVCNGSPCADTAAALLALDTVFQVAGPQGQREISIHDFFLGPGETCLQPGDLVTRLILPAGSAGGKGVYGRISRRRGVDISTVAVLLTRLPGCSPVHRVSLLSVAPRPIRVPEAESCLDKQEQAGAGKAADLARAACNPITDVRGSAEYRRDMVGVLLERGVNQLYAKRSG